MLIVQHPGDKGRKLPIYACHVQPGEGKRIATGGQDCKVRIWSTATILDNSSSDCDKLLATLSNHTGAVLSVGGRRQGRFSQRVQTIAQSWSGAQIAQSWSGAQISHGQPTKGAIRDNLIQGGAGNVESWRAIKVLLGHDSDVADLAWSPSNEYLASCGLDSLVFIWDGKTFDKLKKLEAHQGFVKGITWDPVGKYLATQSDDKTVKIWRTSDWVVEREITEPFTQASSTTFFRRLSWSPDGSCIAMANGENGNVPVSPIVNPDIWISDVSLVPLKLQHSILSHLNPDEDGEEGATKRVVSSVCAIAGQDRSVSIWWTVRPFSAASALDVFQLTVLDLSCALNEVVSRSSMEVDTEPTIAVPPVEPSVEPVEPVEPIEALRSIRIVAVVKVAPRQHANSGNTLEEWTLQTQNVDTARTAVWNHYRSNFNISDLDPTIKDIDSYIHFEKDSRKYCFGPKLQFHQITNTILSNWHTASLTTTVTMQILKHGDSIKTASQFTQYDKAVLQPIIMDRGGAPAEPLHIDIMAQLRERHEVEYRASPMTWR
ncbi:HIR complex subunit [Chytriomyces hyalinus]|nr:HIR complex subunit [Chytriomyces hyalinus]